MKKFLIPIILFVSILFKGAEAQNDSLLSQDQYSDFANMALDCIQKEYPNKTGHVMDDADDVLPPQAMHPAFYGCFDWHSSVHGHWMLLALIKYQPGLPEEEEIRKKLGENLTAENISGEITYFADKTNKSFERTYGWAWLMKLGEELYTWDDPDAREWYATLSPLIDTIVSRYTDFLPKLTYPNRTGEHPNTAFGLSFAWDWAKATGNDDLMELIAHRSMDFYYYDEYCPIDYEPGGFDFISPCLAEADMMGRILSKEDYKHWMGSFLPGLAENTQHSILMPATVTDRSDGKLVHLDGLNLFKAWSLYRICNYYEKTPENLVASANHLLSSTLPNIQSGEYAGEHWLGSFAVYALISGGKIK